MCGRKLREEEKQWQMKKSDIWKIK
jgi:hypothetical protein